MISRNVLGLEKINRKKVSKEKLKSPRRISGFLENVMYLVAVTSASPEAVVMASRLSLYY